MGMLGAAAARLGLTWLWYVLNELTLIEIAAQPQACLSVRELAIYHITARIYDSS